MQAYQERVKAELKELTERTDKLMNFIGSDKFEDVPDAERNRLRRQSLIMSLYIDVLEDRVEAFEKE